MKVFDKAQWHIDQGENTSEVIAKFKAVFSFLHAHKMLSAEGLEMYEFGIDSSISLNERMVTPDGYSFMDKYYDNVINCSVETISAELERTFSST